MTNQQLQILQHSLGRDEYGQRPKISQHEDYRNYFYTGPGSRDFECCKGLVKSGCMKSSPDKWSQNSDMVYFHVTEKGVEAVNRFSPTPPKVSKSKQRYRQYLKSECVETFGEWLKLGMYKRCEV